MYILFMWTIIAATPTAGGYSIREFRDWRPMGEFHTMERCADAAKQLKLNPQQFICSRK